MDNIIIIKPYRFCFITLKTLILTLKATTTDTLDIRLKCIALLFKTTTTGFCYVMTNKAVLYFHNNKKKLN